MKFKKTYAPSHAAIQAVSAQNIAEHLKQVFHKILENTLDLRLKVLLINSTFITGGCFKSIYHGEKVNDYDFYFKSKESAEKFTELLNKSLDNFQGPAFTNMDSFKLSNVTEFAYSFNLKLSKFELPFSGHPDSIKIQFITKYSGTPEEVTGRFDFKHCQNYYISSNETMFINENLLTKKELVYNEKASHPINALKRVQKFIQQGWKISDDNLVKIAISINKLNLKKEENVREQLAGMYVEWDTQQSLKTPEQIIQDLDEAKKQETNDWI